MGSGPALYKHIYLKIIDLLKSIFSQKNHRAKKFQINAHHCTYLDQKMHELHEDVSRLQEPVLHLDVS